MRLGVITTHTPSDEDQGEGWLPGAYRGGAELSDAEYLVAAPDHVDWHYTNADLADDFDRLLITSVDHLSRSECEYLADFEPIVFLHHEVAGLPWRKRLLESARCVMLHTPAHEDRVREWCKPRRVELVLSALDVDEIESFAEFVPREPVALAACRNHPLKGLKNAHIWAMRHGVPLEVMTREERYTVLARMRQVETFVHLPLAFESEGRAVMEAVLAGCDVVANDLVGITSMPHWRSADVLRELVRDAPSAYWGVVCEA